MAVRTTRLETHAQVRQQFLDQWEAIAGRNGGTRIPYGDQFPEGQFCGNVVLKGPIREVMLLGTWAFPTEQAMQDAIAQMDGAVEHRIVIFTKIG